MRKVMIPPDIADQLDAGAYPAELSDQNGTVAVAVPVELFREMFSLWSNHVFGPPGLERTTVEPGDMTTEEAVRFLRALEDRLRDAA